MKDVIRHSVWALVIRVASAGMAYASVVLLGRWLSAEDYGLFGSLISALTFLGVICTLGLPFVLLKLLGRAEGAQGPALARYALGRALCVALALMGGALVLAGALTLWAEDLPRLRPLIPVLIGMVLLPGWVMVEIMAAVLRSQGRVFWALAPRDLLWRGGLIAIGFGVTHLFAPQMHLLMLIAGGALTLWGLAALQMRLGLPGLSRIAPAPPEARQEMRGMARSTWITNISVAGITNLDVICVALLISPEGAAPYFAASRSAALAAFTLNAANTILGPQLSAAFHAGARTQVRALYRFSVLISFVPALAACAIFALFGQEILALFGPGFAQGYLPLLLLSLAHMVNGATGSCGLLLNMTGHHRAHAVISATCLGATVLIVPLLALFAGPVGVAGGVMVIFMAHEAALVWVMRGRSVLTSGGPGRASA